MEEFDVKICVLPGGKAPERKSQDAVGYDCYLRAIVDANRMSPQEPRLRMTLFDFKNVPDDPNVAAHIRSLPDGNGGDELHYELGVGEQVLCGIGVAYQLPSSVYQWTTPRSGLSSKHGITLGNAPGTIDPDYRGEAGLIMVNHGSEPFLLSHGMRIGQVLFAPVLHPREIIEVESLDDLQESARGEGGFGSTGLR